MSKSKNEVASDVITSDRRNFIRGSRRSPFKPWSSLRPYSNTTTHTSGPSRTQLIVII